MSHDPGDECAVDYVPPWWRRFRHVRADEPYVGCAAPIFYAMYCETEPDHDGGDEDDYHNYIPSVDRRIDLRCWAPRDGENPRGYW